MAARISAPGIAGHIWRCGVRITDAGAVFERGAFTAREWARLRADPAVKVEPLDEAAPEDAAEAEEIALVEDEAPGPVDELVRVIPGLEPGDFTQDGQPRMRALRATLPDMDDTLITDAARDEAMRRLAQSGFRPPGETA
jgi:hypothetical protein